MKSQIVEFIVKSIHRAITQEENERRVFYNRLKRATNGKEIILTHLEQVPELKGER